MRGIDLVIPGIGDGMDILRAGNLRVWKDLAITDRSNLVHTTEDAIETVSATEGAIGGDPFSSSFLGEIEVRTIDGKHPTKSDYPSYTRISVLFRKSNGPAEAEQFIDFLFSTRAETLYFLTLGFLKQGSRPISSRVLRRDTPASLAR